MVNDMIYACYVIYNDASLFHNSLKSIVDFVDKVIVVDGAWKSHPYGEHPESTDNVKKIAKSICGKKLIWVGCRKIKDKYIPWNNQIQKRNVYLKLVPENDWFIVLDSDTLIFGEIEILNTHVMLVTSMKFISLFPKNYLFGLISNYRVRNQGTTNQKENIHTR